MPIMSRISSSVIDSSRCRLHAEQPEHEAGRNAQQVTKGPPTVESTFMGREVIVAMVFRRIECDALRHDLAEDQRQVGNRRDSNDDAYGVRGALADAQFFQRGADVSAERLAAKGA